MSPSPTSLYGLIIQAPLMSHFIASYTRTGVFCCLKADRSSSPHIPVEASLEDNVALVVDVIEIWHIVIQELKQIRNNGKQTKRRRFITMEYFTNVLIFSTTKSLYFIDGNVTFKYSIEINSYRQNIGPNVKILKQTRAMIIHFIRGIVNILET
nr:hypothetical protein BgiMline_011286 [Biomphalaria glabrata]